MFKKSVVLPLILVNVVIFLLQNSIPSFTDLFVLVSQDIFVRPWILITSMFLHGSFIHLFFNMAVLFFFGPLVEQRIGSKRFLIFYLISGFFAALAASIFYTAALGASGAIYAILGFVAVLAPNLRVLLWGIIPMKLATLIVVLILFDIYNTLASSNIATFAHFAGLSVGALYAFYLKKGSFKKKKNSKLSKPSDNLMMSDEEIRRYINNRGF